MIARESRGLSLDVRLEISFLSEQEAEQLGQLRNVLQSGFAHSNHRLFPSCGNGLLGAFAEVRRHL